MPLVIAGCAGASENDSVEIVNVSYDPTRELYHELNPVFVEEYFKNTGQRVKVTQSHGGSGAQARAVIDGLKADVVTLALAGDIQALARKELIDADWEKRLPGYSSPYTSTIVFVVRQGNPRNIKDWSDLARPRVKVITPNPKVSGGARWNFLAAWGYATLHYDARTSSWIKKGSEAEARDLVAKIYRNAVKLDTGARGSAQSFVKNKLGDVFISWENEAILLQREVGGQKLEIVRPSVSIRAEPPVAVVDRNVDERGSRAVAEAYLKFLYSPKAQEIIGKHAYRPRNEAYLKLPPLPCFTIRDVAKDWAHAQKRFFTHGGVFDEIYQK